MAKVVIQTGDILDRPAIDEFFQVMPESWFSFVSSIIVMGSREDEIRVSYYDASKQIGIHCPSNRKKTKHDALEELAVSLFCIAELRRIPKRISPSKRREYAARWQEISTGV